MFKTLIVAVFLPVAALADCATPDSHFVSCTLKGGTKRLEVCRDEHSASYWFGSINGKAELALTAKVGEFIYRPWPGIGSTIWEELIFINNGISYAVYGAHQRNYPDHDDGEVTVVTVAGIVVRQGEKELGELRCDAGSAKFTY
ncbi:hypothetical protein KO498_17500 [Lentibacter algarum]|uniref:hypothetical protein n=1 Tax=Lentibacter algarum TaxID=576131 RepID=UPI001C0A455B|nr:hypothetical protein [Lentibacter algarum]MBU2983607.1 hypothetical protein [Lentibacter algarum]